ncbi:ABC transporter substrate-binding protein [Bacillus salitolerans]|uniref:ABC transporter substrate-binding protein n=1 Tax=Bacillus salitolerans TaxID=1437434 RepID=A0ABW4LMF2_9BACI
MDNKLLLLSRSFPSGSVKIEDMAEILEISHRQTSRSLKKWSDEGWLSFTPGRGRGNVSQLLWLRNVEEEYEEQVMKLLDTEPVERISKYLMFDWSSGSKMRLIKKFDTKFGYFTQTKDKLVVPKRYPFLTMHPLEAADAHSAHLVANVFNRLVSITDTGSIVPEIAHSWDVSDTKLRLYLKKDVMFHDGSILSAKDVVDCLEKLRVHKHYKALWSPVEKIVATSTVVVDLHYPDGCSYIIQLLSMMSASIYKLNHDRLIGTGGFLIGDNNKQKTTLVAFKEHFGERPLLDVVEFIQVPKDFKMVYHSTVDQDNPNSTFQVESDSGFGVVMMNTNRHSMVQNKEVRHFLHYVIAKNRHTITQYEPRAFPNDKSCFIGQDQRIQAPTVVRPSFDAPIVVRVADHTERTSMWLKETLEKEGIPVEMKRVTFEQSIHNDVINQEVDLFVHGEIFEANQDLSFYNFLINGFSPLIRILQKDKHWIQHLETYKHIPFSKWRSLNLVTEKKLIESSIMIPLYYEKRQTPFSGDIMNIKIKHFGYVDFSKLWVRPSIEN